MGKVVVMDHPLIQHKIGLMRRTETGSKDFRTLAGEVAMFECYEATRDLELQDVDYPSPKSVSFFCPKITFVDFMLIFFTIVFISLYLFVIKATSSFSFVIFL